MSIQSFTEGSIRRQLVFFSVPIMLTNLLQVSYQFIDSLWVGNLLGANALGAVTISSTVLATVLAFIIGINHAALTILSQQMGRKDEEGLKNYLNAFVVILSLLSLLVGGIGFIFAKPILLWLNTPQVMLEEAAIYIRINFLGILFIMGYNFLGNVLKALGDSKTPLKFVFIAVLLNTIFDPLFIASFKWGIHGAAIATVTAQGIAFMLSFLYILRKRLVPFQWPTWPKLDEITLIFKLGIPAGLQMTVIHAGLTAILTVVNSFDSAVVAGFGSSQRIDSLIMLPAMALGTAVTSMSGQNIGANRWDRVKEIAKFGLIFNLAIMFAVATTVFFFAHTMTIWFVKDEEAVAFGTTYLKTIAFFYPFLGINFILNGVVRGAGAMYQVLVLNILSFWVLRYPLTLVCSRFFDELGIAVGIGISLMISSFFSFAYYQWGGWRKKQLFAETKREHG